MKTVVRAGKSRNGELANRFTPISPLISLESAPISLSTASGHALAPNPSSAPTAPRFSSISGPSDVAIQLVTLDALRCTHNGAETDLPRQKRRFALLVYLAMERHGPREKVAALFYPEVREEQARNRLKQSVFALRQDFGADCIVTDGDELFASDGLILDARDFGTLADIGDYGRALELYKRPFLDGFYINDASEWERWVDRKRGILAATYARAVQKWVGTLIDKQQYDQALPLTTRWLELDEASDHARALHMTALAHVGRPEEALRLCDAWERQLREDEGLRLPAALEELKREIASQIETKLAGGIIAADPEPVVTRDSRGPHKRRSLVVGVVAVAAIAIAIVSRAGIDVISNRMSDTQLDSTRYAVLPFAYDSTVRAALYEQQIIISALRQLEGIAVADPLQVPGTGEASGMSLRAALQHARKNGAGRLVFGSVQPTRAGLHVEVGLYDTRGRGKKLAGAARNLIPTPNADTAIVAAVDELLFGPGVARVRGTLPGSRSVPAILAFRRGQEAIKDWNLASADSAFLDAVDYDPQYTEASLWLAQVRSWVRTDPSEWRISAERVATNRAELSWRDRTLAEALLALLRNDRPTACGLYHTVSEADENDFVALYSYAHCLRTDPEVVRDPKSPSGYAFRSGYATALEYYVRAFNKLPSAHRGLSTDLFATLRRNLMTSESTLRDNRLAPTNQRFVAFPSWGQGDTIETIPFPEERVAAADPSTIRATLGFAVARQRRLFLEIARGWTAEFPKSAEAYYALGLALDMNGHPTAADTLRLARSLASMPQLQELLASLEVVLRVKTAVPHDLVALRRAVQLSDSLLLAVPPGREANSALLAGIAALRGKPMLAADYLERSKEGWYLPPIVASESLRLLAIAATGEPDSIISLAERLRKKLPSLDPRARREVVVGPLVRAATLAFPELRTHFARDVAPQEYYLFRSQTRLSQGDTLGARQELAPVVTWRQNLSGAAATTEAVYPESAVLIELGDLKTAAVWLDRFLNALHAVEPDELDNPMRLGALLRVFELRAEVARRSGDSMTAQQWSTVVSTLEGNRATPRDPHKAP